MQAPAPARQAVQAGSAFGKGTVSQEAACRQVRAGQAGSAACRVRTNWIGRFSQIGLTHGVPCHAHVAISLHVVVPAGEQLMISTGAFCQVSTSTPCASHKPAPAGMALESAAVSWCSLRIDFTACWHPGQKSQAHLQPTCTQAWLPCMTGAGGCAQALLVVSGTEAC